MFQDSNGRDIQLGVTSHGLVVFQANVKVNTFSWSKIVKISFKRKQFFIQLRKESLESYDTLLGELSFVSSGHFLGWESGWPASDLHERAGYLI